MRYRRNLLLFVVCLAGIGLSLSARGEVCADDAPASAPQAAADRAAGHSSHGEAFNEGPRQRAYLMPGMGKVHFPATTQVSQVQEFIDQGVAQLHGFWYFEAERSFRQAAALDPNCAIAYWGMSRANIENESRAKPFIAEAVKRKASASPREVLYIDAMDAYLKAGTNENKKRSQAYVAALENIILNYPEDVEAKAFLGLQLWTNESRDIPLTSRVAADALLRQVIDAAPLHPAHHYRIHLWDAHRAEQALDSAALCGQGSPGIAHMWHMPGHIYSKRHRYADAAWQQEASARVDHAHMMRDRVLPDQIHNFAHNNEWLIRDLIHVGRVHDAIDLACNMIELPRHPRYNTPTKGSCHYGRLRLVQVLSEFELWGELIRFYNTAYLDPADDALEQVQRLQNLGKAHLRNQNPDQGVAYLVELEERLERQRAAQRAAGKSAEEKELQAGKDADAAKKARETAEESFAKELKAIEQAIGELLGELAAASGDSLTSLALLRIAGADERRLIEMQLRAGEGEQAEQAARKLVERRPGEVLPLAELVATLWRRDKKQEAGEAFQKLRALAPTGDLQAPPLARLAPLARELGWPEDWRTAAVAPGDVGIRPNLETLGPFRWRPSPAGDWVLADAAGREHALRDYRGKPVVIIFYLGAGCLHCAQQLQAFAPKTREFAEAGLSLVAISTDGQEGLKKATEAYKTGEFPFPLLSNSELNVFKQYRAFDDFENLPLHATIFVNGEGLIGWQDISFEPFMDVDFVLREAKRQLARSSLKPTLPIREVTGQP